MPLNKYGPDRIPLRLRNFKKKFSHVFLQVFGNFQKDVLCIQTFKSKLFPDAFSLHDNFNRAVLNSATVFSVKDLSSDTIPFTYEVDICAVTFVHKSLHLVDKHFRTQ